MQPTVPLARAVPVQTPCQALRCASGTEPAADAIRYVAEEKNNAIYGITSKSWGFILA